jgi:hypothetical protein
MCPLYPLRSLPGPSLHCCQIVQQLGGQISVDAAAATHYVCDGISVSVRAGAFGYALDGERCLSSLLHRERERETHTHTQSLSLSLRFVTDSNFFSSHTLTPTQQSFLVAICCARHVVRSQWLLDSHAVGAFLNEARFGLRDSAKEKQLGLDFATTLKRADGGRVKIMHDIAIFITPRASVALFLSSSWIVRVACTYVPVLWCVCVCVCVCACVCVYVCVSVLCFCAVGVRL